MKPPFSYAPILLLLFLQVFLVNATSSSSSSTTTTTTSRRQPPNFIIILTDDLDWTLGGANASTLHRTRQWIQQQGKTFTNWFVQTPVCCPSRAELLTGKFFHNLQKDPTIQPQSGIGCMHIDVESSSKHPFYQRDYFAQYFAQLNYTVGIFGKHLNGENPTNFMPNGVDEMWINGGGTYLNPTFTVASKRGGSKGESPIVPPRDVTFRTCAASTGMPCYSTSIIGNASLAWISQQIDAQQQQQQQQQSSTRQPFLALISVKAPHLQDGPGYPQSIPAPWYRNTSIPEHRAPRIPNYNYSAKDHHWLVRSQPPLTHLEAQKVDALYVSRLKTMLSVDDLVQDLMEMLSQSQYPGDPTSNESSTTLRSALNDTYILFTSDNGFRLGQFQMPQCKLHAYENDIRVPMWIRGPGITPQSSSTLLSTHVNIMPTLLGLATHQYHTQDIVPNTMDGMNLAQYILDHYDTDDDHDADDTDDDDHDMNKEVTTEGSTEESPKSSAATTTVSSTTSLLIEYASLGPVVRYNHLVDTYNHTFVALRIMMNHNHTQQHHDQEHNRSQYKGTSRNESYHHYHHYHDSIWNYQYLHIRPKKLLQKQDMKNDSSTTSTTQSTDDESRYQYRTLSNLKYVEYRDYQLDWNASYPPLERELFDLDLDPYEKINLLLTNPSAATATTTATTTSSISLSSDGIRNIPNGRDELHVVWLHPQLIPTLSAKIQRMRQCQGKTCRQESYSIIVAEPNNNNDDNDNNNNEKSVQ